MGIKDPYVEAKNQCGNDACVNPAHFHAVARYSTKEQRMGRLPSNFTDYEEDMIGWIIEELNQGMTPDPNCYPPNLIEEARRRAAS
jgi:hypothetical protein